jgi:SSS family solute:Na+ symporter
MLTNCIEGIISHLFYLVIIAALLSMFSWSQINEVLVNRPAGQSLLNPFDCAGIKDFNIWFVLMSMFLGVYGTMAYQSSGGYNSAAKSAHESRMAGLLGRWREQSKTAVVTMLAICAVTFLHHPDFAAQAGSVSSMVDHIQQPQIQEQMRVPVALSHFLPVGVKGMFCAILLMGVFGGDATHLHSWAGIFVQDVLVPLRKEPFEPKQHIRVLRATMIGVALFAFLFGTLYHQTEYIIMWWNVTIGIYVGGAGAAIIGGLYWKKGTAAGAWTAMLTGLLLSAGGIMARQSYGNRFPLNGMQISFYATLMAIVAYVVVSILTCKGDFDIDRMLHRGRYSPTPPLSGEQPTPIRAKRLSLARLIGFDNEFTLTDKWITGSLFVWSMLWVAVLAIGSVWNWIAPWPAAVWSVYWHITGVGLPILLTVVTGIWFTWGGVIDIIDLFRQLGRQKLNELDDGTVVNHRNLDEQAVPAELALAQEIQKTVVPA